MQQSPDSAPAYVCDLREIERTDVALAGGKGANLGELCRIDGVRVPRGFCLTTRAFREAMGASARAQELLASLQHDSASDPAMRADVYDELRATIEKIEIPAPIVDAIHTALQSLGAGVSYAVRSSATSEDAAHASAAGLHDSFLHVSGLAGVLRHVSRCWASLFAERAAVYRMRHGIDHRDAHMAVLVQEMVRAQASGVLFTADPVSGNRRITSIEVVAGLADALVTGRATPVTYTLRDGEALTNDRLAELQALGRRIERHFGVPQDIEWCRAGDEVHVVQSRPITSLFPIPEASDASNRVYLSVGHQQMMTDAIKPLGLSFWQMTTPRPMAEAGGRLFVDVTEMLASPASRANLLEMMGRNDRLMLDALQTVLGRPGFMTEAPPDAPPASFAVPPTEPLEADPQIVASLIESNRASVAQLRRDIVHKRGVELLDFIHDDVQELRRHLFGPLSHRAVMAGMEATWWLNDRLQEWLGEENAADRLAQSAPNNVTSEMGLALLDVADVMRQAPRVVEFLATGPGDDFVERLGEIEGGGTARDALERWLAQYGMRGTGEIDITRPRWSERPAALLPLLRSNIRNFAAGAGTQRFAEGARQAARVEAELLRRVRALPGGEEKANDVQQMIARLRTFIGYREYPKYGMVSRYQLYKRALLGEGDRLVEERVLDDREDIFYLRFDELQEVVRSRTADRTLVRERRATHRHNESLRAPRVLTSEGEGLEGSYRRDDAPAGALVGLAVSAGIAEGRARVVHAIGDAEFAHGDILVTRYTDPSWTPAFVSIGGMVTEVGGAMTHGAVIAREYGIPAVVAVSRATQRILDGDRIRLDGSAGTVEILSARAPAASPSREA